MNVLSFLAIDSDPMWGSGLTNRCAMGTIEATFKPIGILGNIWSCTISRSNVGDESLSSFLWMVQMMIAKRP